MASSPQAQPQQQQDQAIDLDSLSLEELQQVRQREESRLQQLTARYAQLRSAAARLHHSQMAVKGLAAAEGSSSRQREVMVPLTESVYVPGIVKEPSKLLVELGTGYFVEHSSTRQTSEYLQRKQSIVDANSENLEKMIRITRQNLDSVGTSLQGKLLEIKARQEGARHRAQMEQGDVVTAG